ncbi:MAG: hypothetical protein AAGC91_01160 [Pseudomonadota bacterium]
MSKADVAQLERQILAVLVDDNPQSVRHVFYRMTDPRLPFPVDKTEKGYGRVQRRMVEMRRSGGLPYGWVADATRRGYHVDTFADRSDFLRRVSSLYRADLWSDLPTYCEVWVESRSLAGVLQDTCEHYAVSLYPAGGFSSLTLVHAASETIKWQLDSGKDRALILYAGDFDPAGVLIDQSIESEMRRHLGEDAPVEFRRVAVNEEQIERYELPTKPRKPGDRRATHVRESVEAEAMPAHLLKSLISHEIDQVLPARHMTAILAAEESERSALNLLAGAV